MNNEIEFYINENGIACVPLKLYNDSLEEIERLNNIIDLIKINIDVTIQRIKKQPNIWLFTKTYSGNDEWILERLNEIKNIDTRTKRR